MPKVLTVLAAGLLFAGSAAAQTASVDVSHAWARATPDGAETGAAYLTLQSAAPDRLTGISTPIAGKAELHEMQMAGGIMKMRPLAGLDLPAGQAVTLQPGGVHIMLQRLKEPLRAGSSFPLTLQFAKSGKREVAVTVEKLGAMRPGAHAKEADEGRPMAMPMPAHH